MCACVRAASVCVGERHKAVGPRAVKASRHVCMCLYARTHEVSVCACRTAEPALYAHRCRPWGCCSGCGWVNLVAEGCVGCVDVVAAKHWLPILHNLACSAAIVCRQVMTTVYVAGLTGKAVHLVSVAVIRSVHIRQSSCQKWWDHSLQYCRHCQQSVLPASSACRQGDADA